MQPEQAAPGPAPLPSLLCRTHELSQATNGAAGALWKLAETDRQLDANLVHLPAGGRVGTHREPDLDVLLLVVSGEGMLAAGTEELPQKLEPGALLWLPHGSTRSIAAGGEGLTYLTVHRRRPGMQIRRAPAGEQTTVPVP